MASQLKDSSVRGYAAALGGVKELLALLAKVAPSAITVVNRLLFYVIVVIVAVHINFMFIIFITITAL